MEYSAGGIIVNKGRVVIVEQKSQTFSFPKGHRKEGEDDLTTAYREIAEECGLTQEDLHFVEDLGTYIRPTRKGKRKQLHFYLFTTDKEKLAPHDEDNPRAFWVAFADVGEYVRLQDYAFFKKQEERLRDV